jgi:hypothetical protein
MTDITHQKARALLQAAADQTLQPEEQSALEAHLRACLECSQYAKDLSNLETDLYRVMHANWDNQQPDLNLQGILNPLPTKLFWDNLFGQTGLIGKATVVAALVLGYFIIANYLGIQTPISNDETATILPTPGEYASVQPTSPTPSAPTSLTGAKTQACETVTYYVQENDTLAYIAFQYGTTQEEIMKYNQLDSDTVFVGMELNIPFCDNAPTRTAMTLNNAITVAPANGTIFPTQPQ